MEQSNEILYIKGDATEPVGEGNKIITHINNDIGGWGKGFVKAISRRWKKPENEYRKWYRSKQKFKLGEVQFVQVEDDLWVANMIAQRDIKRGKSGVPPIREEALSECLEKVKYFAVANNCSVHMPRIGCGLAGGKWKNIAPRIEAELVAHDIAVTVYDFE